MQTLSRRTNIWKKYQTQVEYKKTRGHTAQSYFVLSSYKKKIFCNTRTKLFFPDVFKLWFSFLIKENHTLNDRSTVHFLWTTWFLLLLLCVRAEYWKARLSRRRRRCPSSNKVRNQVPSAVYVCRPTKSGINKV